MVKPYRSIGRNSIIIVSPIRGLTFIDVFFVFLRKGGASVGRKSVR